MDGLKIDIDLKELKLLETALDKSAITPTFISNSLDAMGNHLINLIRQKAPKKTGEYAASWYMERVGENTRKIATPMSELYIILEYRGATPHDIMAGIITGKSGKMALHWVDSNGVDQFRIKVHHPGQPSQPHIRPALDIFKKDQITILYASVSVAFPQIFGRLLKSHISIVTNKMGGSVNGEKIVIPIKPVVVGTI